MVIGVAVGREVGSSVGDIAAVGVRVRVGDGATDRGVWGAGTDGPKGEQPSPMMATTPRTQTIAQNFSGTEGRIDDLTSVDVCFILVNK